MNFLDRWFPKQRQNFAIATGDERKSYKNGESLTKFEESFLMDAKCPDCQQQNLYTGPSGGMSTNIACGSCGNEFNFSGISGMNERLSTPGKPDRSRLQSVYGIVDFKGNQ